MHVTRANRRRIVESIRSNAPRRYSTVKALWFSQKQSRERRFAEKQDVDENCGHVPRPYLGALVK